MYKHVLHVLFNLFFLVSFARVAFGLYGNFNVKYELLFFKLFGGFCPILLTCYYQKLYNYGIGCVLSLSIRSREKQSYERNSEPLLFIIFVWG